MGKKTKKKFKMIHTIFMKLIACTSFLGGFCVSDRIQSRQFPKRKADVPYIRINPQKRPDYKDGVPIIYYSEEISTIRKSL